ncbi:MAG TPA: hypothetical protein VMF53_08255 [Alphaproteobacteria bacterium]|nr:hypothetical protein [Alphaproteobacteria bacterium]
MPMLDEIARAFPGVRVFRLADDGRHAYCTERGAFLGRGTALLECVLDRDGRARFRPRDPSALARLLRVGYGCHVPTALLMSSLRAVSAALEKGDLALANILLVHAEIDPLPDEAAAMRLAKADRAIRRAPGEKPRLERYNPNRAGEPRLPAGAPGGGQWTTGGGDAIFTEVGYKPGEGVPPFGGEHLPPDDQAKEDAEDAVARNAIANAMAKSRSDNLPRAGLIYMDRDGNVNATGMVEGNSFNPPDPSDAQDMVPDGATVVGAYYTMVASPLNIGDVFSGGNWQQDVVPPYAIIWSHKNGANVYVGTVSGNTMLYNPATREHSNIGRF